jgi:hypothetical protein
MNKKHLLNFNVILFIMILISQSSSSINSYGSTIEIEHGQNIYSEAVVDLPVKEIGNEPLETIKEISLPSLSGYDGPGTYANYSNGDAESLRVNVGYLDDSSDRDAYRYSTMTGPLHGIFICTLGWGTTENIDLYPGYVESGIVYSGIPSFGVTQIEGNYYASANPEYFYLEIYLNAGESVELVSHVWGYINGLVDYTLNATWINYEDWNTGLLVAPVPEILSPFNGENLAPANLFHDPQRYILLNYSYVPGIISEWNEESYKFEGLPLESTDFEFEVVINGVSFGQLGSSGPAVKLGFEALGFYTISVNCIYFGEIISTTSVSFNIVGYALSTTTISIQDGDLAVSQDFLPPLVSYTPSSPQLGVDIARVVFNYKEESSTEWLSQEMIKLSTNSYDVVLDISAPLTLVYYYMIYDEYGSIQYLHDYQAIEVGADILYTVTTTETVYETITEVITETTTVDVTITEEGVPVNFMMAFDNSAPVFLFPVALVLISTMVIIRRKK